jgi:tRNA pseudouridine55 synthase
LCGVLNLDKPSGLTSHDAVQRVRRLFGLSQVGHAGTLDPAASGVLPLLLGPATRFSQFLQHLDKTYDVVARLGLATDTHDLDGHIGSTSDLAPEPDAVRLALLSFIGEGLQVPPMYSAVRIEGRRLYELAREGKSVVRPSRPIRVDRISEFQYIYPLLSFRMSVSSGTYIRTICHDLGQMLGCGAVMAELKRIAAGPLRLESAISLEELGRRGMPERREAILPLEEVFAFLPAVRVGPDGERRVGHGQPIGGLGDTSVPPIEEGQWVRILSLDGRMLAMGQGRHQLGRITVAPIRVLPGRVQAAAEVPRQESGAEGLQKNGPLHLKVT